MNKLEPCPFCGAEARIITTDMVRAPWSNVGLDAVGFAVLCDVCGATQPAQASEITAIKHWNRRAND